MIKVTRLNAKPGDIIEILQGHNPWSKKSETITIVVIDHDGGEGFYYFDADYSNYSISHSNSLVWGIKAYKKLARLTFQTYSFKEYQWTVTGIGKIDTQMCNLGCRFQVFSENAPKKLLKKYDLQEENNFHYENSLMVDEFLSKLKGVVKV